MSEDGPQDPLTPLAGFAAGLHEIFGRWLLTEDVPHTSWKVHTPENNAHVWNDGNMNPEYYKFPAPKSAEEVVAVLNKFADEMDPQGGPR